MEKKLKHSSIYKYTTNIKTTVKLPTGKKVNIEKLTNKDIYSILVHKRSEDAIAFPYWRNILKVQSKRKSTEK